MDKIFQLFGGLGGIVKMFAMNLLSENEEMVDETADRVLTVSKKDHDKICKAIRETDSEELEIGNELRVKAGDAYGDYLAWIAKRAVDNGVRRI